MDQLDRDILRHLQQDGRLTNAELARRVSLSPTPTLRRVRALEKAGVITGYHASVSMPAVGRGFEVLVFINLDLGGTNDLRVFESALENIDGLIEAHRLYGEPDYILRIALEDNTAYERVYVEQLTGLPGVAKAWSHMIMKTVGNAGVTPGSL